MAVAIVGVAVTPEGNVERAIGVDGDPARPERSRRQRWRLLEWLKRFGVDALDPRRSIASDAAQVPMDVYLAALAQNGHASDRDVSRVGR